MTIALVAHDTKKELMVQFCIAYRQILSEHRLIATGTTESRPRSRMAEGPACGFLTCLFSLR